MFKINSSNHARLSGVVNNDPTYSHNLQEEEFYTFEIEIRRLSGYVDIIPAVVSTDMLQTIKLEKGKFVEIDGEMRSYNKVQDNRHRLILMIFVKDIREVDKDEEKNFSNEIMLTGFLCKNPKYRKTPFGREITDIHLAVNREYKKSDYIPCISWGANARVLSEATVGDLIKVLGRVQSRDFIKKLDDGTEIEKRAYEVSIGKVKVDKDKNNKKKEYEVILSNLDASYA